MLPRRKELPFAPIFSSHMVVVSLKQADIAKQDFISAASAFRRKASQNARSDYTRVNLSLQYPNKFRIMLILLNPLRPVQARFCIPCEIARNYQMPMMTQRNVKQKFRSNLKQLKFAQILWTNILPKI